MTTHLRLPILLTGVLFISACQQGGRETELAGAVQGTTYHIKVVLDGLKVTPEEVRKGVEEAFDNIDVKLSNYRDDSEISKFNRQKTTDWLPASREIVEVASIAKAVSGKSKGCLDLTIKPLFDLWGFSRHESRVPEQAEIDRILPHTGMDKLELDEKNLRMRKKDPDLALDLSSIAQGYTVGAVAKFLESRGIQNYMAEIGGEMKVKGRKANGDEWRIAIEKPTPFTREVQKILSIHQQNGEAIMTSGTYRNFFEEKGQVYSHIIDPKTGKPVNHHLLSVTVLHDDPSWADAWSTALLCLGETEGYAAAETNKLRALFISGEGKELKERFSSEMAKAPED